MSRWIDAEWLKQNFNTVFWSQITKTIDSAPSIEIIRCGECRWRKACKVFSQQQITNDSFCSWGEREGE